MVADRDHKALTQARAGKSGNVSEMAHNASKKVWYWRLPMLNIRLDEDLEH